MAAVDHRRPSPEQARLALDSLYREHAGRVGAICASILRDHHEAEDAAQQVFVSAYRALLRGTDLRDPGAWLATVARNESRARSRRRPSVPLRAEFSDLAQEDPSTVAVRRAELAEAWQAIAELPALQRDLLLRREIRGLAYDELAADLRISHPSVRSRLNRARRTLRHRLEHGGAALTGMPWLNLVVRVFGDASSPALPSVARTAAAGLGAVAVTGGAIAVPPRVPHAQQRQAMPAVRHEAAVRRRPAPAVVAVVPRRPHLRHEPPARLQRRDEHRSGKSERVDRPHGGEAVARPDPTSGDSPGGPRPSDPVSTGSPVASDASAGPPGDGGGRDGGAGPSTTVEATTVETTTTESTMELSSGGESGRDGGSGGGGGDGKGSSGPGDGAGGSDRGS